MSHHYWHRGKQVAVEHLWLPASFALDQLPSDRINLGLAGLVMADQIADIFAVIGEVTAIDLRLDPFVPVAQSQ